MCRSSSSSQNARARGAIAVRRRPSRTAVLCFPASPSTRFLVPARSDGAHGATPASAPTARSAEFRLPPPSPPHSLAPAGPSARPFRARPTPPAALRVAVRCGFPGAGACGSIQAQHLRAPALAQAGVGWAVGRGASRSGTPLPRERRHRHCCCPRASERLVGLWGSKPF
jgi:hypothetical protein